MIGGLGQLDKTKAEAAKYDAKIIGAELVREELASAGYVSSDKSHSNPTWFQGTYQRSLLLPLQFASTSVMRYLREGRSGSTRNWLDRNFLCTIHFPVRTGRCHSTSHWPQNMALMRCYCSEGQPEL